MFNYPIEKCDVTDRPKLEKFRDKLSEWNDLMNGDESHAISGQFADMMWQDAAWRSANEARRFAKDDGPSASTAPLLGAMLDRGYLAGQIIAIGRLLESSNPKQPKRGVVSLRRIVDEMCDARDLITRENFVAHDALPYDYEAVEQAELESLFAKAEATGGVFVTHNDTEGPAAWGAARAQHKLFDQLSGVEAKVRSRADRIDEAFFRKLDSMLRDDVFDDVIALRNKSVAHAADAFSRAQATGLRPGLKLEEIGRAHYLLFAVYQVLSVILLGQWRGGAVPVPQHDQFEHLDKPFIPEHRLDELRGFWKAHLEDREAWMSKGFEEVIPREGL